MAITDFRELALPCGVEDSWMVRIAGDEAYYLLNHCSYLGHLMDYDDDEFRFSSELNACKSAYRFYKHHGLNYPHMGYLVSLQADYLKTLTTQSSSSQVMEFV